MTKEKRLQAIVVDRNETNGNCHEMEDEQQKKKQININPHQMKDDIENGLFGREKITV